MKKIVTFLILYSLFFPAFSYAQLNIGNMASELNVNLSPTVPKPGEKVSVFLEMYSASIDTADISWYVDGKLIQNSKGLKSFSFTAPEAGKTTNLNIRVTLQNGSSFEKSIAVRPLKLDLMWEANSYTPPFYKGKALFPPQGQIKVVALTDSSNMVYKWMVNGNVQQSLGGFGKNTAVISGPILGKAMEIEVEATNSTTGAVARNSIFISPTNPSITFYENSPLYGVIFSRALSNISLTAEEASIVAVPYNVSRDNVNNASYTWRVNGVVVEGVAGRTAVFRKPEGASGRSVVSFKVQNDRRPLQLTEGSFSINFSQ